MKLSTNFTLQELTRSTTAMRNNIDQTPNVDQIKNLTALCDHILQPLRTDLNKPVTVNSGFRSTKLNRKVGGSSRSQHCKGEAADIEVKGMSTYDLAKYIEDNYEFDQLILEAYHSGDPESGWVHVSYKRSGKNRKSVLTATFKDGKASYSVGLSK